MLILGIETSCDDTCIGVLEVQNGNLKVRSNIVSSQVKLHAKYGGVWPLLAKREHQKNLPIVLKKALKEAKIAKIDLISVTVGPGLEPCLWTGINFAKDLAKKLRLPLIPVNHIEAHILANFLNSHLQKIFPAIALVVSGGHTQLILVKNFGQYKILGETRDDAAGECLDKVARILGLGYPGGPTLEKKSKIKKEKRKIKIDLPRPMIYQKNYDFSFSGLKTAVLYDFRKRPTKIRKSKEYINTMAREVQQAVIDVLIFKTLKAAKEFRPQSILLGGGVARNEELRRQFEEKIKRETPQTLFFAPDFQFCTDNGVMVAVAGYFHYLKRKNWKKIEANANLRIDE